MVHYKNTLFLLICLSAAAFCLKAQAQPEETTRKFTAARLAFDDIQGLQYYYGDNHHVSNAIVNLYPTYTRACAVGRLLALVRLAQHVIVELREPEFAEDRFNDLLNFLEAGTDDSDYLEMLELLEKAKFSKLAGRHSFLTLVLIRIGLATGLVPQSSVAALRESAGSIIRDPLFMNNQHELLQVVRTTFEAPEEADALTRIQNVVDQLTVDFTHNALELFKGVHMLVATLLGTPLPPEYANNRAARDMRVRVFDHAVRLQEALRDPQLHNTRPTRRSNEAASLRAGFGGSSSLHSRL